MFKYLIVSVVLVPVLLGIFAANQRDAYTGRLVLRAGWVAFGIFWIALLHYLRFRWQ